LFSDSYCSGSESFLQHCYTQAPTSCSHDRDAGVRCMGKFIDHLEIDLLRKMTSYYDSKQKVT